MRIIPLLTSGLLLSSCGFLATDFKDMSESQQKSFMETFSKSYEEGFNNGKERHEKQTGEDFPATLVSRTIDTDTDTFTGTIKFNIKVDQGPEKSVIFAELCKNDETKKILLGGMKMKYVYLSSDDQVLLDATADETTCTP